MPVQRVTGEQEYTIRDVAAKLHTSERIVRYWISRGELPARRYGKRMIRVRESDLSAFGVPVNGNGRGR